MNTYEKVVSMYKSGKDAGITVKDISKALRITNKVVRRILITEGLWESPKSIEIAELFNAGYDSREIAEKLNLAINTVTDYLPYPKGPRTDWPKTENAIRIQRCRKRKEKGIRPPRKPTWARNFVTRMKKKFGLSNDTVWAILAEMGIEKNNRKMDSLEGREAEERCEKLAQKGGSNT